MTIDILNKWIISNLYLEHKENDNMIKINEIKKYLEDAKQIEQTGFYHKENLYEHTILVAYELLKRTQDLKMVICGLMHDTGKIETRFFNKAKNGYSFYGHENVSAKKLENFISCDDENFNFVHSVVLNHMLPFRENGLNGPKFTALKKEIQEAIILFNEVDNKNSIQTYEEYYKIKDYKEKEDKILNFIANKG